MGKVYYIRTLDDNIVCRYDYLQFLEVKQMLKNNKRDFVSWIIPTHVDNDID